MYKDYLPAGRDPNGYSPMSSRFSDASLARTEDDFNFSLQSSILSLVTVSEDNLLPDLFEACSEHNNRLEARRTIAPAIATKTERIKA
jgi:hypothetical protein